MYSNLWVSFCAAFYSYGFASAVHSKSAIWLVFTGTLSVYLGHRYYKLKTNQINRESQRIVWMKKQEKLVRAMLVISFVSAIVFGTLICFRQPEILGIGMLSIFIAFFYVVPIGNKNLREISHLKVILVSFVYWLIVIGLTSFNSTKSLAAIPWAIYSIQFLYILAIAMLFDIPDVKIDKPSQRTIPQVFGFNRTLMFSSILILVFIYFQMQFFGVDWKFLVLLGLTILFFVGLIQVKNKEFYLSFFGEAMLGVLGIYYLLC